MMLPSQKRPSRTVIVLTLAGLLPFLATGFVALFPEGVAILIKRDLEGVPTVELFARMGALSYAACILSFMGGVRWGGELEKPAERINPAVMAGAVLPAIIAWIGSFLGIASRQWMSGAMFFFAGCFLMLLAWDSTASYPGWYYRLRILVSLCVVACLLVLAFSSLY